MSRPVIEVSLGDGEFSDGLRFEIEEGAGAVLSAGSNLVLDELLERLFGLEESLDGEVCLADESLMGCKEEVLLGRLGALGYASADGGLIGNLRVWENLMLPHAARSGSARREATEEMEEQIIEALAVASVDEERAVGLMPQIPDRLSAFERILCALVRCHLSGFRLLVCDRVFDRLDESRSRRVSALVDWLGQRHPGSALLVMRHSTRPLKGQFGLREWSPVNNVKLEEKSWLAS